MKIAAPIVTKLVSVQPMKLPKGTFFYMDYQYKNTINIKQWDFLMFLNKKYKGKFPTLDELIKTCKYKEKQREWLNRLIKLYQHEYFHREK